MKRRQAALVHARHALRAVATLTILLGLLSTLISVAPGLGARAAAQGQGWSIDINKVVLNDPGDGSLDGTVFTIDVTVLADSDAMCGDLLVTPATITWPATSTQVFIPPESSCNLEFSERALAGWSTERSVIQANSFEIGDLGGITFRNSPHAALTITKSVLPASLPADELPSEAWSFAIDSEAGDARCATSTTDSIAAAGGSTQVLVPQIGGFFNDFSDPFTPADPVVECSYSVTETQKPGFTVSPGATISSLAPGDTAAFTNTRDSGALTVTKVVNGFTDQEFTFTGLGDFTLSRTDTTENLTLFSGAHTLTESAVAGFLQSVDCTDSSGGTTTTVNDTGAVVSLDVAAADVIDCTFTNTQLPVLTIEKVSGFPGDATTFEFQVSGPSYAQSVSLMSGEQVQLTLPRLGDYRIQELNVAARYQPSVACTSEDTGTADITVSLGAGDRVTCRFDNDPVPSRLVVVKEVIPAANASEVFGFTLTGPQVNESFDLDGDGTPTGGPPSTRDFTLDDGTYQLSEVSPVDGYDTSISCIDDVDRDNSFDGDPEVVSSSTATIDIPLGLGQSLQCTVTNTATAEVTINKVVVGPSAPSPFAFTVRDQANAVVATPQVAGGASSTVTGLSAGTYTIDETELSGYDLTSIDCGGAQDSLDIAAGRVTITVAPGDKPSCTFTNTALGSIRIIKDVTPDQATVFDFSGSAPLGDFSLSDLGSLTVSQLPAGNYTVAETGPSGFDVFIGCSGDLDGGNVITDASIAIDLDPGENIVCTFSNQQQATITVVKDEQPDLGTSFSFAAPGLGDGAGFTLADDGVDTDAARRVFANVSAGGYTISETLVDGYTTSVACPGVPELDVVRTATELRVEVLVESGADVTCTFTNVKLGSVEIAKTTLPSGSGPFTFTNSREVEVPPLSDGESFTLASLGAGSVEINEAPVAGWSTQVECVDKATSASVATGSLGVTVELAIGQDLLCTWTNTQLGRIEIIKVTDPGADAEVFSFTSTGLSPASFSLDTNPGSTTLSQQDFELVTPGTYSVTEPTATGWTTTATCDDADSTATTDASGTTASIAVGPGETVRCTFVNTKLGSIAIVKQVEPNSSDTFDFTATGLDPASFALADGELRLFNDVAAGTYTVSELVPNGYDATVSCAEAPGATISGPEVTIELGAGDQVVCTWTNVQRPGRLVIVKDASPNDSQDFAFTVTGGDISSPIEVLLDDDDDPTLSTTWSDATLTAGTYEVTEAATPSWILESLVCDDPTGDTVIEGSTASVALGPDETVTCTFTNLLNLGTIVVIQDTIPDDPQDFDFVTSGLDPSEFTLDDDDDPALANRRTFFVDTPELPPTDNPVDAAIQAAALRPGAYTVTGLGAAGWETTLSCVDPDGETVTADLLAEIDLDAGETVTCTYTSRRELDDGRDPSVPEFGTDPTPTPVVEPVVDASDPDEVRPLALTGTTTSLPSAVGLGLTAFGFALLAADRRLRRRDQA